MSNLSNLERMKLFVLRARWEAYAAQLSVEERTIGFEFADYLAKLGDPDSAIYRPNGSYRGRTTFRGRPTWL